MSDGVIERPLAIMEDIVAGGREYVKERINAEGVEDIHSLVLTEKRMEKAVRLPYSCAISFYGEVIAGVKELEEYCRNQKESSSPYILKRFHNRIHEEYEIGESELVRCTNYLVCKDV